MNVLEATDTIRFFKNHQTSKDHYDSYRSGRFWNLRRDIKAKGSWRSSDFEFILTSSLWQISGLGGTKRQTFATINKSEDKSEPSYWTKVQPWSYFVCHSIRPYSWALFVSTAGALVVITVYGLSAIYPVHPTFCSEANLRIGIHNF